MDYLNKYWIDRGKTYQDEFTKMNWIDQTRYKLQEDALINHLHTLKFSSVLEVGCGFGRITKLILDEFPNIKIYHGIDISKEQIDKCVSSVESNYPNKNTGFFVLDLFDFNYFSDAKFYDLVLAVEVLMHIPPTKISRALNIMYGLSSKYVINVDWWESGAKLSAGDPPWCFQHCYRYDRLIPIPNIPILGHLSKKFRSQQAIFHKDVVK